MQDKILIHLNINFDIRAYMVLQNYTETVLLWLVLLS